MRDFFILWFERVINVVIILAAVAIVIAGFVTIFATPEGILMGLLKGLAVWFVGGLYLIFIGGSFYLGLGIYNNTQRTAEILDRLEQKDRLS